MKTMWKIYDNEKKKVLDEKSYRSKSNAVKGKQKIIRVRMEVRQSYDLKGIEVGHIVGHNDIYNLQCV